MTRAKTTTSTVIPGLRYRDAAAAIRWLCDAFGFEEHLVVPGEAGSIEHAQLRFGNGMIMLSSVRDDEWGKQVAPPTPGAANTQGPYLIVEDCELGPNVVVGAGCELRHVKLSNALVAPGARLENFEGENVVVTPSGVVGRPE